MNKKKKSRRDSNLEDPTKPEQNSSTITVVGIGASAGGLEALKSLLENLSSTTGMAFVVIQHLHPDYKSNLAEILGRSTRMPVREAQEGVRLAPNEVFIIPPNALMTMADGALHLTRRSETAGIPMPIDHFMVSLAECQKRHAIGIILSGTGTDGTLGLRAIKSEGGFSIAQDATAKYDGMPRSAIAAGNVDCVLSPADMAAEIERLSRHPYIRPEPGTAVMAAEDVFIDPPELEKLFEQLFRSTGIDFTHYKQATIQRRVQRRMVLHRIESVSEYLKFIGAHPDEVLDLYNDILIRVTRFFRDPEVFKALKSEVFPALLANRHPDAPLRIWVPGCSTGEEVYSIVISLMEWLDGREFRTDVKVFATDINQSAIDRARSGIYPDSIAADVAPEQLRRFFIHTPEGYQISKTIREICVFARQDVVRDPPFSCVDLISCRNLLIYLDSPLQRRVLPLFHYALRADAFLLLGASESIGEASQLFSTVDSRCRIFKRRVGPKRPPFDFVTGAGKSRGLLQGFPVAPALPGNLDIQREADRVVLANFAPAGVVIDESLNIIQFRGKTGAYLEPSTGVASLNILKMVREGMMLDLRAAIESAQQDQVRIRRDSIVVKSDGHIVETRIEVIPISVSQSRTRYFIVLFSDVASSLSPGTIPKVRGAASADGGTANPLENELVATRNYLQGTIEAMEASNEELRAANEEIVSSNEELQSTNEELQTAKEEVQATNEELRTTNEELELRNKEAQQLSDDLLNILHGIEFPIVLLGPDLRIRRFTPSAGQVLNLIPGDTGRPISHIKPAIRVKNLEELAQAVIQNNEVNESEVDDGQGRYFWMCIRPYRTREDVIEGAVLTFVDITLRKRSEEALRKQARLLDLTQDGVIERDLNGIIRFWNKGAEARYGWTKDEAVGQVGHELLKTRFPRPREEIEADLLRDGHWEGELEFTTRSGARLTVASRLSRLVGDGEPVQAILEFHTDITQKKKDAVSLEDANRNLETSRMDLQTSRSKLAHAERLASIGTLAAGISHELNNPIGGILLMAEAARLAADNPGSVRSALDSIIQHCRRSKAIIENVRSFARAQSSEKSVGNLIDVVTRSIDHVSAYASENRVNVTFEHELSSIPVLINETGVEQVVVNILQNAIQADARRIFVRCTVSRPSVLLTIQNDGRPMTDQQRAHAFDPFYTTRRKSGGTGLGLSIAHGIMEDHGGGIEIGVGPDRLLVFTLTFPIALAGIDR